jgi:hypothetical protein
MKWWQIKKRDADLARELRSDLELEEQEQRQGGISEEEARYAALRAFGNPTLIREQTRAIWSWNWLESLARDLRLSLRTLRHTPGFTVIAILVMALGIGANVALFTVVRGVLLKPLPFHDPDRLVMLMKTTRPVPTRSPVACTPSGRSRTAAIAVSRSRRVSESGFPAPAGNCRRS